MSDVEEVKSKQFYNTKCFIANNLHVLSINNLRKYINYQRKEKLRALHSIY